MVYMSFTEGCTGLRDETYITRWMLDFKMPALNIFRASPMLQTAWFGIGCKFRLGDVKSV